MLGTAAAAEPAPFVLHTAATASRTGALQQLGPGWSAKVLVGDDVVSVGAGQLVSLERANTPRPAPPAGAHLVLANGDLVPLLTGKPFELAGEQLRLQADLGADVELTVPLSNLSIVWFAAPDGTKHPDRLRRTLLEGKRSRDTVHLRNGDVLEGVLTGLDSRKLELEVDKKEQTLELAKVALVALNTDLTRLPAPEAAYGRVVLANGARLTLTSATAEGRRLTGKAAFGGEVVIRLNDLVALDIHNGPAVYLSDLKSAKFESRSFLGGLRWPYIADANVRRGDLRLAGSTFDKGIGMHAGSRLTYALEGKYRRFEAKVGLDDRAEDGGRGAAMLRVFVDGKPHDLAAAGELARHGQVHALAIDVRGAKELTLVVEFVRRAGVVPGDVDWAEARLIRAK